MVGRTLPLCSAYHSIANVEQTEGSEHEPSPEVGFVHVGLAVRRYGARVARRVRLQLDFFRGREGGRRRGSERNFPALCQRRHARAGQKKVYLPTFHRHAVVGSTADNKINTVININLNIRELLLNISFTNK